MTALSRVGWGLAWVVGVLVIALGAAGLVTAMDPGTGRSVPGLAYTGDPAATAALDAAEAELGLLANDVDDLGTQARGALAAMVARQPDTVDAAIAAGDTLLGRITTRSASLAAQLAATPYVTTPEAGLHVSPEVIARHARLTRTLDATDDLDAAWAGVTAGASAAGRLAAQLEEHDRLTALAAEQGRAADYKKAIKTLAEAAATLDAAHDSRDRLAATVDVSVLDEWLARNRAYDTALSGLYDALSSVGGKVTNKVRDAIAAEKAARDRLPPDTRGLVVIMSEIGQGGLTSAVVRIEEAKAALAEALEPEPADDPADEPSDEAPSP